MKVGIKLWSTNPQRYAEEAGFADFIEVMPVTLESVERLAKRKREYTIHVPHEEFGFSPVSDFRKSQKLLQRAAAAAKILKAESLVMHTGYFNHSPSKAEVSEGIKAAARLVKSNPYGKILVENSVPVDVCKTDRGKHYFCYDHGELKELLETSGSGFCLDLEHAAITAHSLGKSYEDHVNELMKLRPDYFHLSGARVAEVDDTGEAHHLSILEGDIPLGFIKRLLRKANKPVCLETPIDTAQRKKEVAFLKK